MSQRKIILGKTYITNFGTEFTPVFKQKGAIKSGEHPDNPYPQRKESRFFDVDGNCIKKGNLKRIKNG